MRLLLSLLHWHIYSVYIVSVLAQPEEKFVHMKKSSDNKIDLGKDGEFLCFNMFPYTFNFYGEFTLKGSDENEPPESLKVNIDVKMGISGKKKEEKDNTGDKEVDGTKFLARTFNIIYNRDAHKVSPKNMTNNALKGPVTIRSNDVNRNAHVQILYIVTEGYTDCSQFDGQFKQKTDELSLVRDFVQTYDLPFKWYDSKFESFNTEYFNDNIIYMQTALYAVYHYTEYSEYDENGKVKGVFYQSTGTVHLGTIFPEEYRGEPMVKPIENNGITYAFGDEVCGYMNVPKE
eukprot:GHVR01178582.1.p1 GENE.GHVR01178582.1~~GHVR01178582.1.p1  ORF type:complete len:289 (+),score=49.49 GHVR01178582.1:115-981(+)